MAASGADVAATLAAAHAGEWSRIVAALIRITGDWSLAEDAAQDAFELALVTWTRDGVPRNPGAWLTTTARNRAIDRIRRATSEARKLREVAVMRELDEWADEYARDPRIEDDRLRLVFTCAHPALPLEARVALTLRTVAGLSTAEIARAFLVPEGTMAQRLVRAKHKIAAAGIPYRVPPPHLLKARLSGVLAVLYLLFNEGYAASSGDSLVRHDLATEAIRMTRALDSLLPDEPEVAGLLALMLLQHSRRAARVDADGTLVPLDEQDRTLWDRGAIDEGTAILEAALRRRLPGPYQVQAAIAACHATAASPDEVDHAEIVGLYDELRRFGDSPVLELNRAIARGALDGPASGLELVDALAGRLAGYYLLPAAQADFLRRLGRLDEAAVRYREALALAPTEPERRFLRRRLEETSPAPE